ncbi:MAG: aldo/keto reductase [Melioribacteraceae bacterium]|nr:aldo/keto reductase [Melioribacteraceae bacterium]
MKYLSKIVAGFWRLKEWNYTIQEIEGLINFCLENGITSFDHADIYGNYECDLEFGKVLNHNFSLREKMTIVTKCGIKLGTEKNPELSMTIYDTSFENIIKSAETSLAHLQTDYIDILLIHRPDPLTDPDEVAKAFTQLKDEGKVKYFGVSNFLPFQYDLLASRLNFPLVTNQIEFSVLYTDPLFDGTIAKCQEEEIYPMAWSPLAGGRLFNNYDDKTNRVRVLLNELCGKYGRPIDEIALAWINYHPSDFHIVLGTGKTDRIKSALDSIKIKLDREDWYKILAASRGERLP